MLIGMQLHGERGADAVLEEARQADEQGFDSVWLFDHLMGFRGTHVPHEPLDSLTLMTAVGATTRRVRLAWAMLNPTFRNPAVLAKMLATLDQITHGRVICSIGAGWFREEYEGYDLPFLDDHAERLAHEREVVCLLRELWRHPAPERVTFEGRFVRVRDLPFNPAPFQPGGPPVWIGGDSEETLELVKEVGDGWVMLRSGNPETLGRVLGAPDWPKRPMAVVRNAQVFVADSRDQAIADATRAFEAGSVGGGRSLEAFLSEAVLGPPEACLARLAEFGTWGITCVRVGFPTPELQARFARNVLPNLRSA
jgi:dimethylsulfone monooxygenase